MALTPERIAELERLKALMQQPAADAQRKAQAAWNAEQMANKKADGGSMDVDAMRLALMGKKRHMAYGGSARNWAPGEEEKLKKHINRVKMNVPALVAPEAAERYGIDLEEVQRRRPHAEAINQWLDSVAHNYIKKSMATEKDPVRQQAENDVLHMNIPEEPGYWNRKGETRRKISGGEQMAKSEKAKTWENRTDAMLEAEEAQAHQDMMHLAPGMYSEKDEWVKKLDPKTKLWNLTEHFDPADLGLDHIRDVLHEDLVSGRIRPEQLSKISMAQAVQRAHQYDQEMEKKRQETAIKQTEGMQTVHEYPEEGLKWIELAMPKELPEGWSQMEGHGGIYVDPEGKNTIQHPGKAKLEEALKYEGSAMGHCVGGYCPDVIAGRSRIFSLRDKKGEPHVTIETEPTSLDSWDNVTSAVGKEKANELWNKYQVHGDGDVGEFVKSQGVEPIDRIVQIKGKGNRKPHKKYIPHVQHFVKSGKWHEDIGDYDNTDLLRVGKNQHATKDELESLGRHHYPEHNMPAENVLMHYDRMRGMPEYQNEQTKNFMADLESGNYRTPPKGQNMKQGGVIKKATGGGVQPSLEQMKMQLMKKAKPDFNDMRNIGINEAPNLDIKAFVPPSRTDQGQFPTGGVTIGGQPLPMGGVDLNKGQPGNQLMPANMAQPAPQAPQGGPEGMPSPLGAGTTPPPQGGSNILQMTPQGQAMAAMKPQGMAMGGVVDQSVGTDHSPSVPYMTQGGITHLDLDDPDQLAKGGKVEKSLHYEPSPSLSKMDIEAMAERMVRQMSGQDNPNKKTLQQIEREKDLPVGIKSSKKMDVPVINYEDLKGSYSVGVPGDTSRGGVKPTKGKSMSGPKAGEYLTEIGGEKLDQPVGLYGGKDYGAYGHPAGWASDLGASAGMFNVVKKLAAENPERDVYGHYHKMSPEALNHAVHMLDAVLAHHKPHATTFERIALLNELMRDQATTTSKHDVPYPEFPGFENPEDIRLQAPFNSGMRKKIIGLLGKEKYFPGGKQKMDDIIYAISHPELRNIETGAGGSSIIKFDPSRSLKESLSPHPTYGHDIPSSLVGRTRYTTPAELLAPRSMHNAKKEIKAMGKKVVPFNQAKMNIIREPIDEQYINQMGEYEMAMKKRLGYKKGGKVKMHTDMDTINLELSNKRKKAK